MVMVLSVAMLVVLVSVLLLVGVGSGGGVGGGGGGGGGGGRTGGCGVGGCGGARFVGVITCPFFCVRILETYCGRRVPVVNEWHGAGHWRADSRAFSHNECAFSAGLHVRKRERESECG